MKDKDKDKDNVLLLFVVVGGASGNAAVLASCGRRPRIGMTIGSLSGTT